MIITTGRVLRSSLVLVVVIKQFLLWFLFEGGRQIFDKIWYYEFRALEDASSRTSLSSRLPPVTVSFAPTVDMVPVWAAWVSANAVHWIHGRSNKLSENGHAFCVGLASFSWLFWVCLGWKWRGDVLVILLTKTHLPTFARQSSLPKFLPYQRA